MIRTVALIERFYHRKGFVYMNSQDYRVMKDNNSHSLAKHFLLFLGVSRQKTPLISYERPCELPTLQAEAQVKRKHISNSQAAGVHFTHLPVGQGFQRYRKSFKIGRKPFYSRVNDKEW